LLQEIYQNLAKIKTNMDIWSKWTSQEAEGPLGNTARPPKWPYHVTNPWELLQSQSQASIQGSLINRQDLFIVDPWTHCHRLRSLHRLTTATHTEFNHVLASQPTWRTNQHPWMQRQCIQGSANAPRWPPTSLLSTSTPMPLYTINRGCGA
jgi:hypothetical protein